MSNEKSARKGVQMNTTILTEKSNLTKAYETSGPAIKNFEQQIVAAATSFNPRSDNQGLLSKLARETFDLKMCKHDGDYWQQNKEEPLKQRSFVNRNNRNEILHLLPYNDNDLSLLRHAFEVAGWMRGVSFNDSYKEYRYDIERGFYTFQCDKAYSVVLSKASVGGFDFIAITVSFHPDRPRDVDYSFVELPDSSILGLLSYPIYRKLVEATR